MIRLALISLLAFAPATGQAFTCHLALVLALDASDSVDAREADLQRRGVAIALTDPEVMAALAPGPRHGALVMTFEWAEPGEARLIAGWTALDGAAAIRAFAGRVEAAAPLRLGGGTGVGAALGYAAAALERAPLPCARRVIDVSGDGPGNAGPPPSRLRAAGALDGLTINGLVIRDAPPDYIVQQPARDPLPYFEREVRQGPGSFVMLTDSYDDYAEALRRKLLREMTPQLALK